MANLVIDRNRNLIVCDRLEIADGFLSRMKGLIGKSELKPGEGLLITPCNSVHTIFMRFPIDVIFLDERMIVIRMIPSMKPYRFSSIVRHSRAVLELTAGEIERKRIRVGDFLEVVRE